MTGTITYILARAWFRAMNGPLADERRRLAGAEPPAAYVSYDPRLLAGAGWYGYRIAFKGGDRDMVRRALAMLAEYYIIRDGYEYYEGGVYVVGVLLRQRVPHYGIGGGTPTPEPDALNFTMPNGGTISLNKTGSPTVVELEYSLDGGATWTVWPEDGSGNRSLTLTAGQRMHVMNTSNIQTGFSTGSDDYYNFAFVGDVAASGNCNSLLCKIPNIVTTLSVYCFWRLFQNCSSLTLRSGFALPTTTLSDNCYRALFQGCTSLVTAPELPATTLASYCYLSMFDGCTSLVTAPELPATTLASYCYQYMFNNCTSLVTAPELPANTLADNCYRRMFRYCTSLAIVKTYMADISAANCLFQWLLDVAATGDFYCPAELTIPTGDSGIPLGWTRHDI